MKSSATAAFAVLVLSSSLSFAQPVPGTVSVTSGNDVHELKITGETVEVFEADTLLFTVKGPLALQVQVYVVSKKRRKKGTVAVNATLVRDSQELAVTSIEGEAALKGAKAPRGRGRTVSAALIRHIEVPSGEHRFRLTLEGPPKTWVAAAMKEIDRADPTLLLGPPAPVPEKAVTPPPPPPGPAAVDPPAQPPPQPPPAAAAFEPKKAASPAPSPSPVTLESESIVSEKSSDPPQKTAKGSTKNRASSPKPLDVGKTDGSVAGATAALARTIASAYEGLGRETAFHRVAVPYFEELGASVQENHLGKLVPELLAAELAKNDSFIVVERERLDQVMREHRLAGLGIVDENTAAEFGKVLGAQSLISGTVGETGPSYTVTVKQVEVETGNVLVSGRVEIERAGLIALSSDAVVKRSVMGAAIRSALVPGWGQLYNGDGLKGYLMMGAWGAILGTAATFTGLRVVWGVQYDSAQDLAPEEIASLRRDGNVFGQTANVIWAVYGVLWTAAVIDAVVNGQDYATVEVGTSIQATLQPGPGLVVGF